MSGQNRPFLLGRRLGDGARKPRGLTEPEADLAITVKNNRGMDRQTVLGRAGPLGWGCSLLNNVFIYYWLLWVPEAGHGPRSALVHPPRGVSC